MQRRFLSFVKSAPRLKVAKQTITRETMNLDDITGITISESFMKYSSVEDLDPSKIDTRVPVMSKMWTRDLLAAYCKKFGLKKSGNKNELISRIRALWGLQDGENICQKEIKLKAAEMFLVLGKENRSLDMISNLSSARIKPDTKLGSISIRGELASVLKAQKLIREVVKNVQTTKIACQEIPETLDPANVVLSIRSLTDSYAVHDATNDHILLAASNPDSLHEATSLFDSLCDLRGENSLMFKVPDCDMGPSLSLFPASDPKWPLYFRSHRACRIQKLLDLPESQMKPSCNIIPVNDDRNPTLEGRLQIAPDSKLYLKLGSLIFMQSITPSMSDLILEGKLYEQNHSISKFLKWFRSEYPISHFIPTCLSFNRVALRYRDFLEQRENEDAVRKTTSFEFCGLNDERYIVDIDPTNNRLTQSTIMIPSKSKSVLIANVSGPLDMEVGSHRITCHENDIYEIISKHGDKIPRSIEASVGKLALKTVTACSSVTLPNNMEFIQKGIYEYTGKDRTRQLIESQLVSTSPSPSTDDLSHLLEAADRLQ